MTDTVRPKPTAPVGVQLRMLPIFCALAIFPDSFGSSLLSGPDVNGDGQPELLVADATSGQARWGEGPFAAALCDAKTGEILFLVGEGYSADPSYRSLATLPDRDGDGVAEILVTATEIGERSREGLLLASGASGSVLEFFPVPARGGGPVEDLGLIDVIAQESVVLQGSHPDDWRLPMVWEVSISTGTVREIAQGMGAFGDLDGRELCSLYRTESRPGATAIQCMAPGTNHPLWETCVEGSQISLRAGMDANRDGVRDVICLLRPASEEDGDQFEGSLVLLNGRDGCELYKRPLDRCYETFVLRSQTVGDYDLDGIRDLAVTAWSAMSCARVRILSASTGRVLHSFEQDGFPPDRLGRDFERSYNFFGTSFVAEQDVDGDGVLDLWLGTGYWKQRPFPAGVGLYSPVTGKRLADQQRP